MVTHRCFSALWLAQLFDQSSHIIKPVLEIICTRPWQAARQEAEAAQRRAEAAAVAAEAEKEDLEMRLGDATSALRQAEAAVLDAQQEIRELKEKAVSTEQQFK